MAGGFIAQTIGIKYVFIVISGACGVSALIGIPLLRETYAPVIRLRLARNFEDSEKAMQHPTTVSARRSTLHFFWVNIRRPAMLLTHSFVCFILSFYMAL
jgi:hypothetical protein